MAKIHLLRLSDYEVTLLHYTTLHYTLKLIISEANKNRTDVFYQFCVQNTSDRQQTDWLNRGHVVWDWDYALHNSQSMNLHEKTLIMNVSR